MAARAAVLQTVLPGCPPFKTCTPETALHAFHIATLPRMDLDATAVQDFGNLDPKATDPRVGAVCPYSRSIIPFHSVLLTLPENNMPQESHSFSRSHGRFLANKWKPGKCSCGYFALMPSLEVFLPHLPLACLYNT